MLKEPMAAQHSTLAIDYSQNPREWAEGSTHSQLEEKSGVPVGMVRGGLQLPSQETSCLLLMTLGRQETRKTAGCVEPHLQHVS